MNDAKSYFGEVDVKKKIEAKGPITFLSGGGGFKGGSPL